MKSVKGTHLVVKLHSSYVLCRWKRVGEITEIICYPIKSCGPVRPSRIKCNKLGFEDGPMRDR